MAQEPPSTPKRPKSSHHQRTTQDPLLSPFIDLTSQDNHGDGASRLPSQRRRQRPSGNDLASAIEVEKLSDRSRSMTLEVELDEGVHRVLDPPPTTPTTAQTGRARPNLLKVQSMPSVPPTPTRRSIMSERDFQALNQARRRETGQEYITALQNFEAQRVGHLEMIRLYEPLSEVRKRTLDYSKGAWGMLAVIQHNNLRIVGSGKTDVELNDGSFMRVFTILRNISTDEVRLKGMKFVSVGHFNPLLPRRENEICWFQELVKDSRENELDQSMVDVPLQSVVKMRTIKLTNRLANPNEGRASSGLKNQNDRSSSTAPEGVLNCRWKLQRLVKDDVALSQRRVVELAVIRLRYEETDTGFGVQDNLLLQQWRSYQQPTKGPYLMADVFCGAGGASAGGQHVGFLLIRSVDSDEEACLTYSLNFPGVVCLHGDVHQYCLQKGDVFIDVLHISPPCQFFSPMNSHTSTQQGWANNERNRAASFSIHQVLLKDRPRIVTTENTAGLYTNHPEDMWPILSQFISLGYSIRFGVLNMADYGVPQSRKRLILIGSCPGQTLPPFPPQTRSNRSMSQQRHLAPWLGAGEAIDAIPRNATHHLPPRPNCLHGSPIVPPGRRIDRTVPAQTLLTSGKIAHYSGRRYLTLREKATLQGFPVTHEFHPALGETAIAKQIGNAVPASFMKQVFGEAIKVLEKTDGRKEENGRTRERAIEIE